MSDDMDVEALKPYQERLAALKSRADRIAHWDPNKRYVVDFGFDAAEIPTVAGGANANFSQNVAFAFKESQVQIDRGVIFLCEEIEVVYSIAGTSVATGTPATFVVAPPRRSQFVDFYLKSRDTGSDREWQNDWVPGNLFQSANLGGLILGDEGHILVSGGAAVFTSIQVAQAAASPTVTGLTSIQSHKFKVSLIGCQVPL